MKFANDDYNKERALDALHSMHPDNIPGDSSDGWIIVSTAAKLIGIDFEQWLDWTSQSKAFEGADNARTRWKSFKTSKSNPRVLYDAAIKGGWSSKSGQSPSRQVYSLPPAFEPEQEKKATIEVLGYAFKRTQPFSPAHPYAAKKGFLSVPALHHLRQFPDDDQYHAGELFLPMYEDGKMVSAIRILPNGKKPNFRELGNSFATLGEVQAGQPVYLAEGLATAWAINQATDCAAVVFGSNTRMGTVARAVQRQHPDSPIVLVPDVGEEGRADKVAAELCCAVAAMPAGNDGNYDAWDYMQDHGKDALKDLLQAAKQQAKTNTAKQEEKPAMHKDSLAPFLAKLGVVEKVFLPLEPSPYDAPANYDDVKIENAGAPLNPYADFVKLRHRPPAARWVIPGVIEHGVVTIAGARGVGKTTSVLPLAMTTAGLHEPDYKLAPKADRWRHVIYITEHLAQVEGIIAGVVECAGWGVTWEQVERRIHIVEAKRLPIEDIATVAGFYKSLARTVDGVEVLPLIVFDTQAACFAMDDENDNSEASKIMAALKQDFHGAPIWIIGHVAKTNNARSDIAELSARGAGAFEGDSIQNLYLVKEGEGERAERFIKIGKHRAEPQYGTKLSIVTGSHTVEGLNEWGEAEPTFLRWSSVQQIDPSHQEQREQVETEFAKRKRDEMRERILNEVDAQWKAGEPLNQRGVRARVPGKHTDVDLTVTALLNEQFLYEVSIPPAMRTHPKRSSYLIRLERDELEAFKKDGPAALPPKKTAILPSWRKPEISMRPAPSKESAPNDDESSAS
jgi:phosphosulfolactate phosphohydrolase-like enzyme